MKVDDLAVYKWTLSSGRLRAEKDGDAVSFMEVLTLFGSCILTLDILTNQCFSKTKKSAKTW